MLYDKRWEVTSIPEIEPHQQVLLDAADLIEKGGWIQNTYQRDGSYCAKMAIHVASKENHDLCFKATEALGKSLKLPVIARDEQGLWFSIPSWNDYPGRTKEQVLKALREAAAAAAAKK